MKLIKSYTEIETPLYGKTILKFLEEIGRVAYKSEDRITKHSAEKFIKMLIDKGHESILEHYSITVRFVCDRGVSHQLVRHRMGSYCLSGDTVVYTDFMSRQVKKRTIKELFEMKKQYRDMTHLRCVDESNLILTNNKIKNVIKSGVKDLFELTTVDGYKIKSTKEHRFFTEQGWKKLKNIKEGDLIYVNGEPLYQDKTWLKEKYHNQNLTQQEIGDLCGVSKHTIRKWVKKQDLTKPLGAGNIGREPHNKNKTKENYEPLKRTSEKKKGKYYNDKLFGEDNPAYKGDDITISGGYARAHRKLKDIKKNKCTLCNKECETEIHHIDNNPKNNQINNLQELCSTCHKVVHKGEVVKKIRLSEIKQIKYVGSEITYDIEMKEPHHNFVANGYIVHNSQESSRYCNYSKDKFGNEITYIEPVFYNDLTLDSRISFLNALESAEEMYFRMLKYGSTPEQARAVLPNALKTEVVATMNLRSWRHFFKLRASKFAHPDIRKLANELLEDFKANIPVIFDDIEKE